MKIKITKLLLAVCVSALAFACSSEGVQSGGQASQSATTAALSLKVAPSQGSSEEGTMLSSDSAGGLVTLTKAWLVIDKVKLEMEGELLCEEVATLTKGVECENEIEEADELEAEEAEEVEEAEAEEVEGIKHLEGEEAELDTEFTVSGPFVVDALLGESTPSISEIVVPTGTFNEIVAVIAPLNDETFASANGFDKLLGKSVVLAGSFDDGTSVRLFKITTSANENIKFESDAGFVIPETIDLKKIILSFNVSNILMGIDIGACLDSGNATLSDTGVFMISDETPGEECDFKGIIKSALKGLGMVEEEEDIDEEEAEELD